MGWSKTSTHNQEDFDFEFAFSLWLFWLFFLFSAGIFLLNHLNFYKPCLFFLPPRFSGLLADFRKPFLVFFHALADCLLVRTDSTAIFLTVCLTDHIYILLLSKRTIGKCEKQDNEREGEFHNKPICLIPVRKTQHNPAKKSKTRSNA